MTSHDLSDPKRPQKIAVEGSEKVAPGARDGFLALVFAAAVFCASYLYCLNVVAIFSLQLEKARKSSAKI